MTGVWEEWKEKGEADEVMKKEVMMEDGLGRGRISKESGDLKRWRQSIKLSWRKKEEQGGRRTEEKWGK